MPSIFLYTLCIGFASGILFRSLFDWGVYASVLISIIGLGCTLLGTKRSAALRSPLFLSSLFCVAALVGMFRMDGAVSYISPLETYVGEKIEVTGVIAREPETREETIHVHVEPVVEGAVLDERILLRLERFEYAGRGVYGDTVQVRGLLEYPEPFETDGGRVFEYRGYLEAQGVLYIMRDPEMVIEGESESYILKNLYSAKQAFMESLEEILPHPHSGLGEGILLGVKSALGDELTEAFRKTGIIHIVVLSGYNVLIVVEALMYLLAYFFRPRARVFFGILGIVTFAFLVGFSATVVRACIMASILVVARGTNRLYSALRALALAGVGMIFLNPYLLVHDIGFQLSFLATLGLILFSSYFENRFTYIPTSLGMRSILSATIATQIAVLPILLYHTGMLSFVSIIVNMLVLPAVPLAMLLTFLTGVTGLLSISLGMFVGYPTYLSLSYIILVARWFGDIPFSAEIVPVFPFWIVVVSYGVIGVWYVRYVHGTIDSIDGSMEPRIKEMA